MVNLYRWRGQLFTDLSNDELRKAITLVGVTVRRCLDEPDVHTGLVNKYYDALVDESRWRNPKEHALWA